jgi:transposase-like protein
MTTIFDAVVANARSHRRIGFFLLVDARGRLRMRVRQEVVSFATNTRDKATALAFMKKLMKRHGSARATTTDGLRSYKAAMTELGNAGQQAAGRWANHRVENSHLPFDDVRRRSTASGA